MTGLTVKPYKAGELPLDPMRYIFEASNKKTGTYFLCTYPLPNDTVKNISRSFKGHNKADKLIEIRLLRDKALIEAWGNELGDLLLLGSKPKTLNRKPRKDSKTGKNGVSLYRNTKGKLLGFAAHWSVQIPDKGLKQSHAYFNKDEQNPPTFEEAFIQASMHRDRMTGQPVLSKKEYMAQFRPGCLDS